MFSSAARERKQQQLDGRKQMINKQIRKMILYNFNLPRTFKYICVKIIILESSNGCSNEKEDNDEGEEKKIKDVIKEAKAAARVGKYLY